MTPTTKAISNNNSRNELCKVLVQVQFDRNKTQRKSGVLFCGRNNKEINKYMKKKKKQKNKNKQQQQQ